MGDDHATLRGTLVQSYQRESRRWPRGRICSAEGCRTRLSVYNGSLYCWVHEPGRPWDGHRSSLLAS